MSEQFDPYDECLVLLQHLLDDMDNDVPVSGAIVCTYLLQQKVIDLEDQSKVLHRALNRAKLRLNVEPIIIPRERLVRNRYLDDCVLLLKRAQALVEDEKKAKAAADDEFDEHWLDQQMARRTAEDEEY